MTQRKRVITRFPLYSLRFITSHEQHNKTEALECCVDPVSLTFQIFKNLAPDEICIISSCILIKGSFFFNHPRTCSRHRMLKRYTWKGLGTRRHDSVSHIVCLHEPFAGVPTVQLKD